MSHHPADVLCDILQLPSLMDLPVVGAYPEPETVAAVPGEYVEMDVKHFLARRLSVREMQIHALAPQATPSQGGGDRYAPLEHTRAEVRR